MSALTKANAILAIEQARQNLVVAIRQAQDKGVYDGDIRDILNINVYSFEKLMESNG